MSYMSCSKYSYTLVTQSLLEVICEVCVFVTISDNLGLNFVPTFDNIMVHPKHGNIMVMWWCLPVEMGMAFHLSTIAVHVHGYVAFPAGWNGHGIPPVHYGSTCVWSCSIPCLPEWTRHSPVHHRSTCAWSFGVSCRPEWTRHSTYPPWQYTCMVMWRFLPAGMDTAFHLSTVAVHVHGHVALPVLAI